MNQGKKCNRRRILKTNLYGVLLFMRIVELGTFHVGHE